MRVAQDVRRVPFEGRQIPVLDCTALVVSKALFDRTKDWADIEEMVTAGAVDMPRATAWLERLAGPDRQATIRLASLA